MRRTKGVFIILQEFLGSRELHFGKPRVFFSGITLPMEKVLLLGWSSFVMNDLLNFVMFFVIDEIWWWRWEVPSVDVIFVIGR